MLPPAGWPAVLFLMALRDPVAEGAGPIRARRGQRASRRRYGGWRSIQSRQCWRCRSPHFQSVSSFGGFTLTFENGAVREIQSSFGPFFAERAPTLGVQGAISLGVNVQSRRFASFEGRRLRNGELASTIVIDGRVIEFDRFTFDVNTQTTSVVASLAVDDDKDVSVIIPIVRTTLSGAAQQRADTGGHDCRCHWQWRG